MRFCILTLGCRANQADSFGLEEELRGAGHLAAPAEQSELVVVNTCAVTGAAERSARQAVLRLARANPSARVVLTGCYAGRQPQRLGRFPNVFAVVPNAEKGRLAQAIGLAQPSSPVTPWKVLSPGARGRTVYPLKVQTGCDEACSYCVVPATRGPSTSRPLEAILEHARQLSAAGYRETILTGVHLGAWGRDLGGGSGLHDLLTAIDRLAPGDLVFRLSSLEPMDCTPAVIDRVARSAGRFVPHFHLPLQHASDEVLAAMRRPYTFDHYRRLLEELSSRVPGAAIGTDVIAGFPGETRRDSEALERSLEELPLAYAHVFAYSDRPGTEAARRVPKVPPDEIRARAGRLRERAAALRLRFEAAQVGTERQALTLGDGTVALTDNYLKVRIAPGRRRNERVRVRVTSAGPPSGEVVE